ncbi:hypothetical protein WMF18_42870 [Sorangium sp. So ce315]|uniref:hypothetical protein n=1 Tax=Sorangium sp. So ce315 TaxID=3133299 RepID=UPI003F612550
MMDALAPRPFRPKDRVAASGASLAESIANDAMTRAQLERVASSRATEGATSFGALWRTLYISLACIVDELDSLRIDELAPNCRLL